MSGTNPTVTPDTVTEQTAEEKAAFKEKLRSLQFPSKPYVEVKSRTGSTQTHHHSSKKTPTGRIDADIHPEVVRVGLSNLQPSSLQPSKESE